MCNCQKFAPIPYKGRIGYMNGSPDPSCPTCRVGAFAAGQALPPSGSHLLSPAGQVVYQTSKPAPMASNPVISVPRIAQPAPMGQNSYAPQRAAQPTQMGPVSGPPPRQPVSGSPPFAMQYAVLSSPDVFHAVPPYPPEIGYSAVNGFKIVRKLR